MSFDGKPVYQIAQDWEDWAKHNLAIVIPSGVVVVGSYLGTKYALTGDTGASGNFPCKLSRSLTLRLGGNFDFQQNYALASASAALDWQPSPPFKLAFNASGGDDTTHSYRRNVKELERIIGPSSTNAHTAQVP